MLDIAIERSFADYTRRKCYNGLFSDTEAYIPENVDSIEFRYNVHNE